MQTVEFQFEIHVMVKFGPQFENGGQVKGLHIDEDGIKFAGVRYYGDDGVRHFQWFREDELRRA